MIALDHVFKNFGPTPVLKDLTLELADSGITCLLGASGCGKSTAMRIAAGLLAPDSGEVLIPQGSCGVVFQDARLLPWLTTRENLLLAIPRDRRGQANGQIAHVLEDVALSPAKVLGLFPRELSGGMAQRAGIARALLRGSQFLMLDEPFASLDAMTRADLQGMLLNLVLEHGMKALFVTHDMEEAFRIAARILIMSQGKVEAAFERSDYAEPERQAAAKTRILEILTKGGA